MANTGTTTRTKSARAQFFVLALTMAFFAVVNLGLTMTPAKQLNEKIETQLNAAVTLPPDSRASIFDMLRREQEKSLAHKPAEPYGWSRLAYLRAQTQKGDKASFDALRMSDLVSPYEAPQLAERAYMWHTFAAVETPEQQSYQDALWTKAFGLERDSTWSIAVQNNLVKDVEQSLQKNDSELYDEWKSREAEAAIKP